MPCSQWSKSYYQRLTVMNATDLLLPEAAVWTLTVGWPDIPHPSLFLHRSLIPPPHSLRPAIVVWSVLQLYSSLAGLLLLLHISLERSHTWICFCICKIKVHTAERRGMCTFFTAKVMARLVNDPTHHSGERHVLELSTWRAGDPFYETSWFCAPICTGKLQVAVRDHNLWQKNRIERMSACRSTYGSYQKHPCSTYYDFTMVSVWPGICSVAY